jgi:hypothetical protein
MAHEDFSRGEDIEGSSNRAFGIVFAVVFTLVAGWPLLSGQGLRWWAAAVSLAFLLAAFLAPDWLAALNRAWTRLGLLLGRIVSPIVLAILFFGAFTPFGLLMRLFRKDPLRTAFDRNAATYWIERVPPGPDPAGMKDQF